MQYLGINTTTGTPTEIQLPSPQLESGLLCGLILGVRVSCRLDVLVGDVVRSNLGRIKTCHLGFS